MSAVIGCVKQRLFHSLILTLLCAPLAYGSGHFFGDPDAPFDPGFQATVDQDLNLTLSWDSQYSNGYILFQLIDVRGNPSWLHVAQNVSSFTTGTAFDDIDDVPRFKLIERRSYLAPSGAYYFLDEESDVHSVTITDVDQDGIPDDVAVLVDDDGDGVANDDDIFPNDPSEWADSDQDGLGDNSDVCPNYAVGQPGHVDTDGDGICDYIDDDIDGDGVVNDNDIFPNDSSEWADTDQDGIGDNADICPNSPADQPGQVDTDGDGVCDYADAFDNDPSEWIDTDGDGIGNNSDPYPNDPSPWFSDDYVVYSQVSAGGQWLYIVPKTLTDNEGLPYHLNIPAYKVFLDDNGLLSNLQLAEANLNTQALIEQNCSASCTLTAYKPYQLDINKDGVADYLFQGQGSASSFIINDALSGTATIGHNFGADLDSSSYPTLFLNAVENLPNSTMLSISACDGASCSVMTFAIDEAPLNQPTTNDVTITAPAASVPAAIAGSFDVGTDGAASYSIPILAAGGVAGITPSLSLAYNSNGGNGVVGLGWSMQGLSAVTRCGKSYFHDGQVRPVKLNGEDRFCLNGQRLFAVGNQTYGGNGTQYKTEIDNYLVITSHGGSTDNPDYFKVVAKDGSTSYFGREADARQVGSNKVITWAIDRVESRLGNNPIRFRYKAGSTYALRIDRIDYAYGTASGNDYSSTYLKFEYLSTRPDIIDRYAGGARIIQAQLLEKIHSYNEGALLRTYDLNYKPQTDVSQLEQITECVAGKCFQPTTFSWPEKTTGSRGTVSFAKSGALYTTKTNMSVTPADFNGDGLQDLFYSYNSSESQAPEFTLGVAISNGSSFIDQPAFAVPTGPYGARFSHVGVADVNLDGKDDVYKCRRDFGTNQNIGCEIYQGTSSGISSQPYTIYPRTGPHPQENEQSYSVTDINGDKLPDFVYNYYGPKVRLGERYVQNGQWKFRFANTDTSIALPGAFSFVDNKPSFQDMTGDGLPDAIGIIGGEYAVVENKGNAASIGAASNWVAYGTIGFNPDSSSRPHTLIDMNADGHMDVLWSDGTNKYVSYNSGKGFKAPYAQSNLNGCVRDVVLNDLDHDGWVTAVGTSLNRATLQLEGTIPCNTDISDEIGRIYADINGDGNPDEIEFGQYTNGVNFYPRLLSNGLAINRITQFDNGLGRVIDVTYKPLTDDQVYTAYADTHSQVDWSLPANLETQGKPYHVADYIGNMQVVSDVTIANGTVDADYSYFYEGAMVEPARAGWLGFSKWIEKDLETDRTFEKHFRMDYPFNGMLLLEEEYIQPSSVKLLVSKTDMSPATLSSCGGSTKHVYMEESKNTIYLPDSPSLVNVKAVSVMRTTINQDCYGNTTSLELVTTPINANGTENTALARTITTSYDYPDNAARIKGLAERETLEHEDSAPVVTEYVYTSQGLLDYELLEPGDPSKGQKVDYTYDAVGNRIAQEVSALPGAVNPPPSRESKTLYDINNVNDFRYLQEVYDAKDHLIEKITARNEYGLPTRIISGLNGLIKEIEYDVFGRPVLEWDNTGAYTKISYGDGAGITGAFSSVTTESATGQVSTVYSDALGREIATKSKTADGSFIYAKKEYNAAGEVTKVFENCTNLSSCVERESRGYDAYGRLTSVTRPSVELGNTYISYSVVQDSNVVGGTRLSKTTTSSVRSSSSSIVRSEAANAFGEVVMVGDADATIYHHHSDSGQLLWTRSSIESGKRLENWYDNLGRKTKMIDSEKGTRFYEYNIFGELVTEYRVTSQRHYSGTLTNLTQADYEKVVMDYDTLGRLTARWDYQENNVLENSSSWQYDTAVNGLGRLHKESGGGLTKTHFYDELGRSVAVEYNAGSEIKNEFVFTSYDEYGRVKEVGDTIGITTGVEYRYNSHGFFTAFDDLNGTRIYSVDNYNSRGQITHDTFHGGILQPTSIQRVRGYYADSGRLQSITVGTTQQLDYTYDFIGNITSQRDRSAYNGGQLNHWRYYCYDDVNRLVKTSPYHILCSNLTLAEQDVQYSALGRITYKAGTGNYVYNRWGYNGTTSDAVTYADGVNYNYDDLGNLTSDTSGRTLSYSVFDKPLEVTKGSDISVKFYYGADMKRWKREDITPAGTVITYYIGGAEKVVKPQNNYDVKRYVGADLLRTYSYNADNSFDDLIEQVLLKDHLGSVHRIVDLSDGASPDAEPLAFTEWGQRRSPGTWSITTDWSSIPNDAMTTTQGYTGHEMVDAVGIIHMNGRIYDPKLARMLQADPFVPHANNPQSYNRYTYVSNNPINRIDPSGYSDCPENSPGTGVCGTDDADNDKPIEEVKVTAKRMPSMTSTGSFSGISFAGGGFAAGAAGAAGVSAAALASDAISFLQKYETFLHNVSLYLAQQAQKRGRALKWEVEFEGKKYLFEAGKKRQGLKAGGGQEGAGGIAAAGGGVSVDIGRITSVTSKLKTLSDLISMRGDPDVDQASLEAQITRVNNLIINVEFSRADVINGAMNFRYNQSQREASVYIAATFGTAGLGYGAGAIVGRSGLSGLLEYGELAFEIGSLILGAGDPVSLQDRQDAWGDAKEIQIERVMDQATRPKLPTRKSLLLR